jgi:hypothetical protein
VLAGKTTIEKRDISGPHMGVAGGRRCHSGTNGHADSVAGIKGRIIG